MREELADADELGIRYGAHAYAADDLALDRAGAAAQRLRGVDHLLGRGKQLAAGGREHHAAGNAFEQRDAELVFERLDLGADRRLADVQPLGGAGEVAELGDRGETS